MSHYRKFYRFTTGKKWDLQNQRSQVRPTCVKRSIWPLENPNTQWSMRLRRLHCRRIYLRHPTVKTRQIPRSRFHLPGFYLACWFRLRFLDEQIPVFLLATPQAFQSLETWAIWCIPKPKKPQVTRKAADQSLSCVSLFRSWRDFA